jgi:3-hydroxyisobutyrate dehydrogenase-like beta-hydroxyacid dehydrogenase
MSSSKPPPVVGIVATGEMGSAIGRALRSGGVEVITALDGRSARSRSLAVHAGIIDVGTLAALADRVDVFLSIVPPAAALGLAREVASVSPRGRRWVYADLNAIAPQTALEVGTALEPTGTTYVDGGIIGFPPGSDRGEPHVWVAGPDVAEVLALRRYGLDVRVAGTAIGNASVLKMAYASITKGLTAIGTQSLVMAAASGLLPQLLDEMQESQAGLLGWLERMVTSSPPKAHRWVAEMQEIATSLDGIGLGGDVFKGVAGVYGWLATTTAGRESPEARTPWELGQLAAGLVSELDEPASLQTAGKCKIRSESNSHEVR